MALSSQIVKLLCLALVAIVVAAPAVQGLTCGQVSGSLGPCIGYLRGPGGDVPMECCNGIKSLNGAANSPVERQTACRCLKSVAGTVNGIDLGLAAGLPGKCGVNVPYKISPSTDCNSVQ